MFDGVNDILVLDLWLIVNCYTESFTKGYKILLFLNSFITRVFIEKILKQDLNKMQNELTWSDFEKVEMRIGTILEVNDFPEARNPAYQIHIDFGNAIGVKKTSAQITKKYTKEELIGKQIVAVINFPKKQIGNFMSECLLLGSLGNNKEVVLLSSDKPVENGLKVG
jgi:tRNA-binding protein